MRLMPQDHTVNNHPAEMATILEIVEGLKALHLANQIPDDWNRQRLISLSFRAKSALEECRREWSFDHPREPHYHTVKWLNDLAAYAENRQWHLVMTPLFIQQGMNEYHRVARCREQLIHY